LLSPLSCQSYIPQSVHKLLLSRFVQEDLPEHVPVQRPQLPVRLRDDRSGSRRAVHESELAEGGVGGGGTLVLVHERAAVSVGGAELVGVLDPDREVAVVDDVELVALVALSDDPLPGLDLDLLHGGEEDLASLGSNELKWRRKRRRKNGGERVISKEVWRNEKKKNEK